MKVIDDARKLMDSEGITLDQALLAMQLESVQDLQHMRAEERDRSVNVWISIIAGVGQILGQLKAPTRNHK